MIIDMHIHEMNGSSDSRLTIEEAINEGELKNIDGLCFTDHDSLYLKDRIQKYQEKTNLLLIVGVEINTLDGDLLCYGISELPKKRMTAKKTIDFVHKRGGVCIAAHPYRNNNRGLKDKIVTLKDLDAVEVLNGRTLPINNVKSFEKVVNKTIKMCGGSDAHEKGEIGKMGTYFDVEIKNEFDLINAIKNETFYPINLEENESMEIKKVI